MIGDIVEFLKSAKNCVDIIIKELEELKDLEEHKIKKINLFIEIIKELGLSVVNLEKAYEEYIPLEHKLKYLIIKELKFDLEDFTQSLREYRIWYKSIQNIIKPYSCIRFKCKTKWLCCGSNISNIIEPGELTQIIEPDISGANTKSVDIIDASIQLANILPSIMNKRLDESFHKIMEKLMIVIELEKDIFGTAININHPILRRAWMKLGPNDKLQNEVDQYKIEESLLVMLKEENHGIIVNEQKCRELISDFLEGLEKKAGNKPNGRISIDELNECVITDINANSVLGLLGLTTQPGCNLSREDHADEDTDDDVCEDDVCENDDCENDDCEDNSFETEYINISTEQILKVLAKFVSEQLSDLNRKNIIRKKSSSISLDNVDMVFSSEENQTQCTEQTVSDRVVLDSKKSLDLIDYNLSNVQSTPSKNSTESRERRSLIQSLKKKMSKKFDTECLIRLYRSDDLVFVSPEDNSGILVCDGYGSNWPYKTVYEFDIPDIANLKLIGGIKITCECSDQEWGGTGHVNIRYQIGDNKIIPAFFVDREKNTSGSFSHFIKLEELESHTHITFWLCCPPWSGWSATLKSIIIDLKSN